MVENHSPSNLKDAGGENDFSGASVFQITKLAGICDIVFHLITLSFYE